MIAACGVATKSCVGLDVDWRSSNVTWVTQQRYQRPLAFDVNHSNVRSMFTMFLQEMQ